MFLTDYDVNAYLRSKKEDQIGEPKGGGPMFWIFLLCFFLALVVLGSTDALAGVPRLPGSDETDKLQAAGSLLRIIDSFLFKFGARIMAGLAVLAGGWSVKEMAFGRAVLCFVAAIVIGTAPMWVKNIFEMGGGTLFSMLSVLGGSYA